MAGGGHTPVMLPHVLEALAPREGGIYVDGTYGAGGYANAILDAAPCTVWGIDRDPRAVAAAADASRLRGGRLTVIEGCLGDMVQVLAVEGITGIDGVALDLGVSSMQIDQAERGFSFRRDGPLDMRMGAAGMTAADVVNSLAEADLADLIFTYGEERASRRIARAIVEDRGRAPITRTGQLADLVRRVVRPSRDSRHSRQSIDPATRTFQALRIYVNDELGELDRGLVAAEALLNPGGRLVVVSFHSLEDRRVKEFFKSRSGGAARPSRHQPEMLDVGRTPSFRLLRRRVTKPSSEEISTNPRARSARLRAAERSEAAAWPVPQSVAEARTMVEART